MELILEIFVCACESAGKIRYATFEFDITDRRDDPDLILSEELTQIGLQADDARCYAHSTSWRYEPGKTVITYLVWSTLQQLSLFQTRVIDPSRVKLPCAAGRMKPRPIVISEESVLSHGLRHFRFLLDQQDTATFDTSFSEEIVATIGQLEPAVAGRIN
jgi:hypothetical protein